jgi:hypothetical protein
MWMINEFDIIMIEYDLTMDDDFNNFKIMKIEWSQIIKWHMIILLKLYAEAIDLEYISPQKSYYVICHK